MAIFMVLMFIVFGYGIKNLLTGKMTKNGAGWFLTSTIFVSFFMFLFLEI
jgi:hypothetical protein